MHDIVFVRILHGGSRTFNHRPCNARCKPVASRTTQQGVHRLAFQPFHHQEKLVVVFIEVEDVDDIGMR